MKIFTTFSLKSIFFGIAFFLNSNTLFANDDDQLKAQVQENEQKIKILKEESACLAVKLSSINKQIELYNQLNDGTLGLQHVLP